MTNREGKIYERLCDLAQQLNTLQKEIMVLKRFIAEDKEDFPDPFAELEYREKQEGGLPSTS